jgi:hypothetical protein
MYTWGPSNLDPTDKSGKLPEKSVIESLDVFGPLRKKGQGSRRTLEYHDKSSKGPTETVTHYVLKGISFFDL